MKTNRLWALLLLLAVGLAATGAQAVMPTFKNGKVVLPPVVAEPEAGSRLLLEGGWALPLGDLADGLDATPTGFGARPGFELGVRWRFAVSPRWSVGPSLHLLGYGDATGLGSDGEKSLAPSALVYGVEALFCAADGHTRPFAGLAPGVVRRKLSGPGKDHVTPIEDTSVGLGLAARVGVRVGTSEFSVVYHLDRFASRGFFASGVERDYNWDTVVVRYGWLLP